MSSEMRAGRPKASSRETLAEAACELFLEKGFEATSVADIASRAGVSRSSFFNYFASKSDVLWAGLDERIIALEAQLADHGTDAAREVHAAAAALADSFAPDSLALAFVSATAMGVAEELEREASLRRSRVARAVAARFVADGADRLAADVAGAAWGGAILAAVEAWARDGAGRTSLARFVSRASSSAGAVSTHAAGRSVRQLRLVVQVPQHEEAVAFYRDALGMPESEVSAAEGGARVVILDAGRASLELVNAAQVELIDRVETDGGRSDQMRVALEVPDAAGAVHRATATGAELEAPVRETPWRSLNARLRGPGGVQLTLFEERDDR